VVDVDKNASIVVTSLVLVSNTIPKINQKIVKGFPGELAGLLFVLWYLLRLRSTILGVGMYAYAFRESASSRVM
jgi:hypothetical protein